MKIWVDFFKPTGKWYGGGVVDMGYVRSWDSPETQLQALWQNQNVLVQSTDRKYWTIVLDDLDSERYKPEYNGCWKRVL